MTICYLAPQLTALESTFVYEELLAVERRGVPVVPVSVSKPERYLVGHDDLLQRTVYLYRGGVLITALKSLAALFRVGSGHLKGARLLFSDIRQLGLSNPQSGKLVYQYIVAAKLARILITQDCRHLHVHFAHVPAQIAMYASELSSVPFTIMAHANDIFERGLLLQCKAQRAVKMLTISYFNRDYLLSLGIPDDKLAVVRCGVSFSLPREKPSFEQKKLYRIGTLARLVEKKGIDDLIRAVVLLRHQSYQVELCIAGEGPLREQLGKLVRESGGVGKIHFDGSVDHDQVSSWLRGLDLFVLACKKDSNGDMDGIPVVLMEAMSQSIPVISTKISGIPELVVHGKTGLTAVPANPEDLAGNIDTMLQSAGLRTTLVGNAREHVVQEFGQEVNIRRLLGYFDVDSNQ